MRVPEIARLGMLRTFQQTRIFKKLDCIDNMHAAMSHRGGRFNGMFALGWYRREDQSLVLARDPVGTTPVSWWWSPDAFVFGSPYDQVVRHRRCRRGQVDPDVLGLYLRLGFLPAPYGLIEGTGQVEPGHWLRVRAGENPEGGCFRSLADAPDPSQRLYGADAADAVAEMVDKAVARQLVADVPVGVFLSGGVDSPLVAAAMTEAVSGPVDAFTIGTDDAASDESAAARAYAEVLDVRHHLETISGSDALGLLGDVAQAYPEPFGDYSSFPTLMVSELASQRVKAVLSGDGGDELFWGYPRFAKVRRARPWFRAPRTVRQGVYAASKFLPGPRPARGVMFDSIGDWYLDAHSGLRNVDLDQFAPDLRAVPDSLSLFTLEGKPTDDDLLQWMRRNELACHLPMILQKVDRASMYHGLEVRVPLLDLERIRWRVPPAGIGAKNHTGHSSRQLVHRRAPATSHTRVPCQWSAARTAARSPTTWVAR